MTTSNRTRVLILGAGFAGIGVVQELLRLFQQDELEITVVDQHNFSLFTPMLTEAAGGAVDPDGIVVPIRDLAGPRVTFEQGKVDAIDTMKKTVTLVIPGDHLGIGDAHRTLEYDHLIIALGSVTNYHHISGLVEHSVSAKSAGDAITIRNRALALLERANEETDTTTRQQLLTIVVGGGGFSGVETMAAVNGMVRDLAHLHPNIHSGDIRTIIVQPGDRLLPEINDRLAGYAQHELQKRGVEVMLKTDVSGAGENWVEVKPTNGGDTRRIATHLLIWAGGVTPSPVIDSAGLQLGKHHGIIVDATCAVSGHPGVWALGDCAEIPNPGKDKTYAPTAQNATREGKRVALNIHAVLHGGQPQPFVYRPIGELAIVGKRSGVASVFGMQFKGVIAWAMWRAIYLAKLPGTAQRVRVALNWTIDALFGRDIAELAGGEDTSHGNVR